MRKLKQVLVVLVSLIAVVSFFTACDDPDNGNDKGKDKGSDVTYTLTVGDISISQGGTQDIDYTVTASDGSSTTDISVELNCSCTDCEIVINGKNITVPADAEIKEHNFTATAKKGSATVAARAFKVSIYSSDDITITGIEITNMAIFRFGDSEINRTISYTLMDGTSIISNAEFLAKTAVEFASNLTITGNVIQSDKTYDIDTYEVTATVKFDGDVVADVEKKFDVVVTALMFTVLFHDNANAAIADLTDDVEYGDKVTDPGTHEIAEFDFDGWYTTTARDVLFNFDTAITAATNIYGKYTPVEVVTYDLVVHHVFIEQGETETIDFELTASDSDISGIIIEYVCRDCDTCTLTIDGNDVTADIDEPDGIHHYDAFAKKDDVTVAETHFTITVAEGGVTYALGVNNVSVTQGQSQTITYLLEASDGSDVSGITIEFTCTSAGCSSDCVLTIDGYQVSAPVSATTIVHNYKAEAKLDDVVVADDTFTITVTARTHYSINVTVTLGPDADLLDGEHVWIGGNFYGDQWTESGGLLQLTNNPSGTRTWTVTVPNIPIARTTIEYNIHTGGANINWAVHAFNADRTLNNAHLSGVINETVETWLGRPIIVQGNLLQKPGFEGGDTGDWSLGMVPEWTFTGLNRPTNDAFFTTASPMHQGVYFRDFGNDWNTGPFYLSNDATLTISQVVPATANGLTAGMQVRLSVWMLRNERNQRDIKLLVGKQEIDLTSANTTQWAWGQISHVFTLNANDFEDGYITVGLQYTATSATTRTGVDTFFFGVAD